MDSAPNLADWLQAGSAVVTALASLWLLRQISLAKEQLKSTAQQIDLAREQMAVGIQWNKVNATFTYFTNDTFLVRERAASEALESLGVNTYIRAEPLEQKTVEEILADSKKYREVKDFLNLLEDYASAVRVGALEADCSYGTMSGIVLRYTRMFMPFVDKLRSMPDGEEVYLELERVSLAWQSRYEAERAERLGALEEARKRTNAELEKTKRLLERELEDTLKQLHERTGVRKKV